MSFYYAFLKSKIAQLFLRNCLIKKLQQLESVRKTTFVEYFSSRNVFGLFSAVFLDLVQSLKQGWIITSSLAAKSRFLFGQKNDLFLSLDLNFEGYGVNPEKTMR